MRTSESIDKLSEALAIAQGEFKNPERNREVNTTAYKFSYSTLDCVIDAVRGPLSKNGLAIIQASEIDEGALVLTTRLAHASGQWVESDLSARPADLSPQKIGSTITYLRRYALTGLLGIASEEDDDSNHGGAMTAAKARPAAKPKASPINMDASQPSADAHPPRSTYHVMEDKVLQHSGNDEKLAEMETWVASDKCLMTSDEKDRIIAKIVKARKTLEAVAEPALRH